MKSPRAYPAPRPIREYTEKTGRRILRPFRSRTAIAVLRRLGGGRTDTTFAYRRARTQSGVFTKHCDRSGIESNGAFVRGTACAVVQDDPGSVGVD